jgi:hypothetical protein
MTGIISITSAPLVLIADDLPHIISSWTKELAGYGINTVTATSLPELDAMFAATGWSPRAAVTRRRRTGRSTSSPTC